MLELLNEEQITVREKSINMNIDKTEEKTSKKSVLLVATFAAFLTPFLGSAVNLALPSIGKDLNANAISLGWESVLVSSLPQTQMQL